MPYTEFYESKEMYLETILKICSTKSDVRAKDIADEMGFSKASVSRALSSLIEEGLVLRDSKGLISLSPSGRDVAIKVYDKHRELSSFFIKIGVSPDTAEKDACRIEHIISDETFSKIKNFSKSLS